MLIPVVQHSSNSHHQNPRVIPYSLKAAYLRLTSIALSVMLCALVTDLFLARLPLPESQTLANDQLYNHRLQE